jgi:hypothetical protein
MLIWDGLQLAIPQGLAIAGLHNGYLRMAGDGQAVEIRFGPEKKAFDPGRDGRRILRSAGLPAAPLAPCEEPWAKTLPGTLYGRERLYVLHLDSGGLAALLYTAAPPAKDVARLLASLDWTPPSRWRQWRCFDLSFMTPPDLPLRRAEFHSGRFLVAFAGRGTRLTFLRLGPADIVLSGESLQKWGKKTLTTLVKGAVQVTAIGNSDLEFCRKTGLGQRLAALLPGQSRDFCGTIRHARQENKILLFLAEGRQLDLDSHLRIRNSYALVPSK